MNVQQAIMALSIFIDHHGSGKLDAGMLTADDGSFVDLAEVVDTLRDDRNVKGSDHGKNDLHR